MAHLINEKRQSATIKSYISAIKAVLADNSIKINQDEFLLSSLTRACKIHNDRITTKFPIYRELMAIILAEIKKTYSACNQPYLSLLYRTLFSTAYFGLFRASELTNTPSKHAVKVVDVQIVHNKRKFMFILRSSKTHSEGMQPQIVKISSESQNKKVKQQSRNRLKLPCPFDLLRQYSKARRPYKNENDQFFIFNDN